MSRETWGPRESFQDEEKKMQLRKELHGLQEQIYNLQSSDFHMKVGLPKDTYQLWNRAVKAVVAELSEKRTVLQRELDDLISKE